MSHTSEDDNEISFTVKFLGRVEALRPDGVQVLDEAMQSLKTSDTKSLEKEAKKSKVCLFLSMSGIDILENKTKFLLYTCPLSTVSFCGVLPTSPKTFGFIAKHPVSNTFHCYMFHSSKMSHVLVSAVGDAFRASRKEGNSRVGRDLIVESLRHKIKMLQRENADLKRRLREQTK